MDGGGEAGEYRFSCGPWEASPEKSWVDRPTQGKPKVHPTEKLISGHGQKQVLRNVEERGRHPALPPSFPAGPSHVSCATRRFGAVPSKVPAKVLKAGSETGQIHSLDGVRRAAGCLVMNYICNHNDHIAAKNIQIEIMKSLGRENKNRASSFLSKTCPFSCLKLY